MKRRAHGIVYLVGAGPGDPGLMTVKGLRRLSEADVVVYDRLVNADLLRAAPPEAERIYVGKSAGGHALAQTEISELLASKAEDGKKVVRLKGGDPFVFGRGGEEAEALAGRGIPFEVVPGVTAATAVPCYAGIPVTHRGITSSLALITGHEDPAKDMSTIAWQKIATGADTLVVLMVVEQLAQIVELLLANGRAAGTPAALIQDGTGPRQRTVVGTLADIAETAAARGFAPPAVLVVGDVVRMRDRIRWFDNRPLFGKRVLVTRARSQANALSELLVDQGAEPVEAPAIEIEALSDASQLDQALRRLAEYSWIVFTSRNGVDGFFDRMRHLGLDVRELKGIRVCAIGPATAKALENRDVTVDYIPQEFVSESIVEGLAALGVRDKRLLVPRAAEARPNLVDGLSRLGALVDEVAAYRAVESSGLDPTARKMLVDGEIDATTFTSSSTVRNLASMLGSDWVAVTRTTVACIGPVTAATAIEYGLRVDVVAQEYTMPGLVQSLVKHYQGSRGG